MIAEQFDVGFVRKRLLHRRIEWFSTVDSTMIAAARLAREGSPSGTIVGAEEQGGGIGRHGHSWHSEPGAGLYVSLILRLRQGSRPQAASAPAQGSLPLVMLALGLAAQEAIAQVSGLAPDLRWPNDVLLGGKKCAGILAHLEGDVIVAGIGINVHHAAFPEDIRDLATSLAMEGARVRREELLVSLVGAIDEHMDLMASEGPAPILELFSRASSYVLGRHVQVDQPDGVIKGMTCGLDPSGFLRVRQDNGIETVILAGGVRPA
jgi:BirA family transcriptional regulator, biotin operon repressor / biotin---[acetyl-CoA-carboxylase] ligase